MTGPPAGHVRIGSLCSGYRGLDLGVQTVLGGAVVWDAEYDPDASRILAHHWPNIPNHGDITTVDWNEVEPVDVLTAGYPCQPFSHAGKREGENDARHLWPFVADAVRVLRPRLVVLENVAGHLSLGFGRVLGDLAAVGYDARWVRLRAADVGAPHGRARVFVVAEDNYGAARGEWRVAAPGQAESRGARADARGRGGTPASDDESDSRWFGHGDGVPVADASRNGRDEGWPEPARLVGGPDASERSHADWGRYGPAIGRWAATLGRPAPAPTEPGRNGKPRLSPAFVEWLMGLPAGHVTAVPGLTRNAQLRILGNGVVPQQAAAALQWLLREQEAAA